MRLKAQIADYHLNAKSVRCVAQKSQRLVHDRRADDRSEWQLKLWIALHSARLKRDFKSSIAELLLHSKDGLVRLEPERGAQSLCRFHSLVGRLGPDQAGGQFSDRGHNSPGTVASPLAAALQMPGTRILGFLSGSAEANRARQDLAENHHPGGTGPPSSRNAGAPYPATDCKQHISRHARFGHPPALPKLRISPRHKGGR